MRAVRAVKDSGYHAATSGLSQQLETFISNSNGDSLDYVLEHLVPLLTAVIDELCLKRPASPGPAVALWILERCELPAGILEDLQAWAKSGDAKNPWAPSLLPDPGAADVAGVRLEEVDTHAASEAKEVRPPEALREPSGSPTVSPKTKRAMTQINGKVEHFSLEDREADDETDSAPNTGPSTAAKAKPLASQGKQRSMTSIVRGESLRGDGDLSPRSKRGVVIWKDDSDHDNEHHQSEGEVDDMEQEMALRRLRGSCIGAPPSPGRKSSSSSSSTKRRRFTVNISKTEAVAPPVEQCLEYVRAVPTFHGLDEADMLKVVKAMNCQRYDSDEIVSNFGCVSERFHIVVDGVAKVSVPHVIGRLKDGDFFGEEALRQVVADCPTQVAALSGPITTLSLTKQDYESLNFKKRLLEKNHGQVPKQQRVATVICNKADSECKDCRATGKPIITDYEMTEVDREMISMAVKNNVLCEVLQIAEEQFSMICDSVYLVGVDRGEVVCRKGENGLALFIVQEGHLNVHLDEGMRGDFKLMVGDAFGELALLYNTPRMATVEAARDCKLWVLTRSDFQMMTRMCSSSRTEQYTLIMSQVPAVRDVINEDADLRKVAGVLEEISFLEGDEVCVEGEDAGLLYILYEGQCESYSSTGEVLRVLNHGDWVGEEQLMKSIPAKETVRVVTETAVVLALDASSFRMVIKAISDLKRAHTHDHSEDAEELPRQSVRDPSKRGSMTHMKLSLTRKESNVEEQVAAVCGNEVKKSFLRLRSRSEVTDTVEVGWNRNNAGRKLSLLRLVGVLGEGSFGGVVLLKDKVDSTYYALKGLRKDHIKREKLEKAVQGEHQVLSLLDSKFVVNMHWACQDSECIYFVLEPALGGELFDFYHDRNMWGDLEGSKFYIACITLALQALQLRRVVWRDLKLENCLLDSRGYLKITDMGIAKVVMGKTYTVCGSDDYIAPETLKQTGHNRAADWWACGVLLYIMMAGRSPFDAPAVMQIYKNIVKGFSKVVFPPNFPADLIEVIKSLCRKKPEERITMQKGGADNLKCMAFFTKLKWDELAEQTLPAPLVPEPIDEVKLGEKKLERGYHFDPLQTKEWDGGFVEMEVATSDPKHISIPEKAGQDEE
mmetsp:Transcript_92762/g.206257  ORF Transcript_92762/g.206257 Transcript_92762/m.206257 type:complete len:1119 (-) Transcript_92762:66-3422(-)